MLAPRESLSTRFFACLLALALAFLLGGKAFRHGLADYWARSSEVSHWEGATAWEPGNGENWHRLGRYYQTDFEHADLQHAIFYYERAASLSRGSAEYWLDLAEAKETAKQLND